MKTVGFRSILTLFALLTFTNMNAVQAAGGKNGKELYNAALFQDIPRIKSLIAAGADVNHIENGRPIVSWAAQNGNAEVVAILLKAGANPNITDTIGQTALMRAIDTRQIETIKAILTAKADPNVKAPDGDTALTMAIEAKLTKVVQELIAAGAKTDGDFGEVDPPALLAAQSGLPASIEMLKVLAQSGANLNVSNEYYSPLSYAVEQSNQEVVEALLELGANPNAKPKSDQYPLELALDKPAILAALLKAKADPDIKLSDDTTPLQRAVFSNNVEAVKLLMSAGADPKIVDPYGSSPREIAERNGNAEIVALLSSSAETAPDTVARAESEASAADCTVADASRMHMELLSKLEDNISAGNMSPEIVHTFRNDTKDWSQLLTNNPPAACQLLEKLAANYGVK